jgi:hypothetical protein
MPLGYVHAVVHQLLFHKHVASHKSCWPMDAFDLMQFRSDIGAAYV